MTGGSSDAIRWLENAASDIAEAVEEARAEEEREPNLNLFRVLRIERNEVGTHSRILRELLDPAGSHGQRGKPLSLFLGYCKRKLGGFADLPDVGNEQDWRVRAEVWRPRFGRTDIEIESRVCKTLIVIENKVDAPPDEDQCKSYLEFLETQKAFSRRILIYLTPRDQDPPLRHPRCEPLSYETDIKAWLDDLIWSIEASTLKRTLGQYRDIVTSLEAPLSGELSVPGLVKFVKKKENLENALRVRDAVDAACRELDDTLWETLKGALDKRLRESSIRQRHQGRDKRYRWLEIWPENTRKRDVGGTYLVPAVQVQDDQITWGIAWEGRPPAHLRGVVSDFQAHLETRGLEIHLDEKNWLGHVAVRSRLRALYQQVASGEDIWTPITENVCALLTPEVIRFLDVSNEQLASPEG